MKTIIPPPYLPIVDDPNLDTNDEALDRRTTPREGDTFAVVYSVGDSLQDVALVKIGLQKRDEETPLTEETFPITVICPHCEATIKLHPATRFEKGDASFYCLVCKKCVVVTIMKQEDYLEFSTPPKFRFRIIDEIPYGVRVGVATNLMAKDPLAWYGSGSLRFTHTEWKEFKKLLSSLPNVEIVEDESPERNS